MVRQELADQANLMNPWPQVGSGVLEFGDRPLQEQIRTFAEVVFRDGIRRVYLLPLFLMMGRHVQQDLPEAIQQAQALIPAEIDLVLCPSLGSHPELEVLVQERMAEHACDRWILMAHGTRRPGGNVSTAALAARLGVTPTYWSTEPSLETQLGSISEAAQVGIVPYFLFTGSIIDAIRETVDRLQSKFPNLKLWVTPPLNPSPLLAKLLLDRCPSSSASS
jgi:sirohydrochlorin cobaltochelatase